MRTSTGGQPHDPRRGPAGDGRTRHALESALSRVHRDFFGRGPSDVGVEVGPDVVVVRFTGSLTRFERSLLASGHEMAVRAARLESSAAMRPELVRAIEQIVETPLRWRETIVELGEDVVTEVLVRRGPAALARDRSAVLLEESRALRAQAEQAQRRSRAHPQAEEHG